ncbi:uncharacterized protein C8Q71DRAFT_715432, partial [Rhodofomes roseus]
LIVGDYFDDEETYSWFTICAEQANEVIVWLRSRTFLLALLREIQENNGKTPLSVILAALTRWTTHYLSYKRLLDLHTALRILKDHPNLHNSGTRDSLRKTDEMVEIIDSPVFWHNLARYVLIQILNRNHLEPLAIASMITQANHCRLDQVLLTFAWLYLHYKGLHDLADATVRSNVLRSIELRWGKCDQDVFIAAVILNPYHRAAPFKPSATTSRASLVLLLVRLYKRFYKCDRVPVEFQLEVEEYLLGTGRFSQMKDYAQLVIDTSIERVSCTARPLAFLFRVILIFPAG